MPMMYARLFIPEQLDELVFDRVGFVFNFFPKALAVSISTAARLWQKIQDAFLSNFQYFKVFGYNNSSNSTGSSASTRGE